jgi:aspartate racemase
MRGFHQRNVDAVPNRVMASVAVLLAAAFAILVTDGGGLGPAATVYFLDRLVRAPPASSDADHLRVLVDSDPSIPDRQLALLGDGPSPGPALGRTAAGLEWAGATLLVMPCNTAHAWAADIGAAVAIPFVDMIQLTAEAARDASPGGRVGILATAGCLHAGLYQVALRERGLEPLILAEPSMAAFTQTVHEIKADGPTDRAQAAMEALAVTLIGQGADALIAGCTEVPLVLRADRVARPLIESTDALVQGTLDAAGRVSRGRPGATPRTGAPRAPAARW